MKAKILVISQSDKSGFILPRIYLEPDFEQAKKDLDLIATQTDKTCYLQDSEIFDDKRYFKTNH
ncbi:MAG: hypothetical protein IPO78_17360 [Saprospiraceae bacterium]|nr:hypothetical protein [Saprospiraceae bacterium]